MRAILSKWADRGYIANLTVADKEFVFRPLLDLQVSAGLSWGWRWKLKLHSRGSGSGRLKAFFVLFVLFVMLNLITAIFDICK